MTWRCDKHNTFGDDGYSCSVCGYPLGAKMMELKNGELWLLRRIINLYIVKIFIFEVIPVDNQNPEKEKI